MNFNSTAFESDFEGDVRFDPISKAAYSIDASILEVKPLGIVIPKTRNDLFRTVEIAKKFEVPIIPRGAGTGITGGCLGEGLILDTSKYLQKILEINTQEEYVICEPGVVQDRLNEALNPLGYRLGPDTSTGNRATLGGMLANNAAGARSLRYGMMVDHILEVKLLLSSGEELILGQSDRDHVVCKKIFEIRDRYREEIQNKYPKTPRRVSGYRLDTLLNDPINLSQLIAGSEGTLGIISEMKLRIVKNPRQTTLCISHFDTLQECLQTVPEILAHHPISLELIDRQIIERGRASPALKHKLDWLIGNPEAILLVEYEDQPPREQWGYAHRILEDPLETKYVWELRKSGLGLLLSKKSYNRAIAFIEDLAIPPAELCEFMQRFLDYLKMKNKTAGIYGHVGAGCLHIRPFIDLRDPNEVTLMTSMMQDITKMVRDHGGVLSGEHGDGMIRSWLNRELFGEQLYQAMCEVKAAFDPLNLMNPGKVVHAPVPTDHLRLNPHTPIQEIETFFDFSREGGFALAVDLCNGNAQCRKKETLMCPSFQATNDEYDTTRARAQSLRAIVQQKGTFATMTSREVYDVLDLCLECKGCKTECPSQVDMAKMKAEFLFHYQKAHGIPLRNYLFGYIGTLFRYGHPMASFLNKMCQSSLGKTMLSTIGISPNRSLPLIAKERFSAWAKGKTANPSNKRVILFNDTFTEFNHPEIGQAAYQVLSKMGYHVIVPPWNCCGRTLISKGMLKEARKKAEVLRNVLKPFAEQNIPIIGLEPSCILTLKDDYRDLIKGSDEISANAMTFDEFLAENMPANLQFHDTFQEIYVHTHCHQKALIGSSATLNVLKKLPNTKVTEIPSGCCGMAGSFGYEKEHEEISMKIGELVLFPSVRKTADDAILIANGTSCRAQILHGTSREAFHLADIMYRRLI